MKVINIIFRVSESERNAIKHDAHQHDMTVSDYIRWLIAKERKKNDEPYT